MTRCLVVGMARHPAVLPDLTEALAALPEPLRMAAPPLTQPQRLSSYIASRRLLLETLLRLPSNRQPADGAAHLRQRGAGFPFWSVSHTGGLVACAWSTEGPCGVDLERSGRPVRTDRVIQRYFHAEEQAWLAALPVNDRQEQFLDLWTRKEAVMKSLGVGIAGHLAAIVFAPGQIPPVAIPGGLADRTPGIAVFRPDGDFLAVAWQGPPDLPLIRSGF